MMTYTCVCKKANFTFGREDFPSLYSLPESRGSKLTARCISQPPPPIKKKREGGKGTKAPNLWMMGSRGGREKFVRVSFLPYTWAPPPVKSADEVPPNFWDRMMEKIAGRFKRREGGCCGVSHTDFLLVHTRDAWGHKGSGFFYRKKANKERQKKSWRRRRFCVPLLEGVVAWREEGK